ncbi:hypothetical protein GCM10011343_12040 [Flavobacterium orientale]|uniref:Uncharacterized protein n=2 Tax=Flavobacterium orientale TaxID=1756020 RepID=A0A916XZ02_9FLAO|nr:hypothetical protein GCM10011343_12040 [Flavobacterium orientale]
MIYSSCIAQKNEALDSIFNQTKKIEILAFYDRYKWEREDKPSYMYQKVSYIKNNKIEIREKYLRNIITLNKEQIYKLKTRFENCESEFSEIIMCYMPRHIIVFYNEDDEIIGYIEICFDCNRAYSSKNLEFLAECTLRQKKLFKEFGITYFDDTEEEKEEFKRKRKEESDAMEEKYKKYKEKKNNNE